MKVNGENFILTFIKDGLAYPVVLNEEQKVAFDIAIRFIPSPIQVGSESIGKVMKVGELKKMKEAE